MSEKKSILHKIFPQSRAVTVGSCTYSFALSLSIILGYQLKSQGHTWYGIKGKLAILGLSLLIAVIIAPLVGRSIAFADKSAGRAGKEKPDRKALRKVFFVSCFSIFLLWFPAFFAFWPAILSYDFNVQYISARTGLGAFTTHHPLIHTYLIRLFLLLGDQVGSAQMGMAFFALMQMLILSASMAYSCETIAELTRSPKWGYITAAFFALFPVHPVLSLCVTKDVLFSAFFLLFITFLIRLSLPEKSSVPKVTVVACVLTGLMTMLFRNNALYAFVVFAPFFIFLSGKKKFRNALISLAIILLSLGALAGMKGAFGAGSGSKIEMYSVVLQTFARTGLNQRDLLTEEEYAIIDRYVPAEVWESYNPGIADNIKACTQEAFESWGQDKTGMLKDWLYIGAHYPNDYIDAFLALTCGYWSLEDETHTNVWGNGMASGTGLISTFNASSAEGLERIENRSFLPGLERLYKRLVNDDVYLQVPVLRVLFKPAFYCWILGYLFVAAVSLKKKDASRVTLWPVIYLLTLYLGPVVNYRYVYPILIVLPVFCAFLLRAERE